MVKINILSVESFSKGDAKPTEGRLMIKPMKIKQREASVDIVTVIEDKRSAKADTTLMSVELNRHPRQKAKKKLTSESKVKLPVCGPPKQESKVQYIMVKPANPNNMHFNNAHTNRRVGDALHITPIKPTEPKLKPRVPLQPQKKACDPLKFDHLDSGIRRKKTFIIPPTLSPSGSSSSSYQNKNKSRFDNYILQGIPVPTSNKGPLSTKPKGVGIDPRGAPINFFRPKTKSSSRKQATTPMAYSRQQRPSVTWNERLPRVNTPVTPLRRSSNDDNFFVNMLNNLG